MIKFANAKINLGLNIRFKREDGFHELSTVMVPIPVYDVLEILPADNYSLKIIGLDIDGTAEDNLITKAFRLFQAETSCENVRIILQKNVPMGAGLGGGSADAAYTLLALQEVFGTTVSNERLKEMSAKLGSDCPFFIDNTAQLATGRGEVLENMDLDLKGYFLHLLCPEIHISTKEAYAGVEPGKRELFDLELFKTEIPNWKDKLHNDFEDSIFPNHGKLKEIKEKLYRAGAEYAAMSGSGSAMFGICKFEPIKWQNFKGKQFVCQFD
jgi:4-diphosphocytidyl-2-C-methyl-D-erythritol kinase